MNINAVLNATIPTRFASVVFRKCQERAGAIVLLLGLALFNAGPVQAQVWSGLTAVGGGTVVPPATTVSGGISGSVKVGQSGDQITSVYLYEIGNPNALASKSISIGRYPVDTALSFSLSTALTPGSHQLYITASSYNEVTGDSPIITITVAGQQIITFNPIGASTYGGAWPGLAASASSGLAVTFSSMTPSICGVYNNANVNLLAAGTCTIAANQGGNGNYYAAPQVTQSFDIAKGNQALNFPTIGTQVFAGTSPAVSASVNTGLPVTITSQTPSVCGIAGSNVTLLAAGTCTLIANQSGTGNYNAVQATQSFSIVKANQSIAFTGPSSAVVGTPIVLSASATSGLGITFSSSTTGVCTVTGNTANLISSGTCAITASQGGDGNFNAATAVTSQFPVNPKSQSISFGALPAKTYGDAAFSVSATADSGLAVSFSISAGSSCSVAGATVTIAGGGTCTINANQAGNGSYAAAPQVTQSFNIAKANQTITFAGPSGGTVGTPIALSASSSSGLAISFAASPTTVCTIVGNTVNLNSSGTCTITASQGGNGNFNAATAVTSQFPVNPKSQTISFAALSAKTYGDAAFSVSATADSGLAVSFSAGSGSSCSVTGTTVTIGGSGTCTINANQAGNGSYAAAPQVAQSFSIAKANQTITFAGPSGGTVGAPITLAASASSGLAVNFVASPPAVCTVTGSTVNLNSSGTCAITAKQGGNGNFNAAVDVARQFAVGTKAQTITFGGLPAKTYGDPAFAISATASSGLAVAFSSSTSGVCSVVGTTVTLLSSGTCTINASQQGDTIWSPAAPVAQSFTVAKKAQSITFGALPSAMMGTTPILTANASSGLAVSYGSATTGVCTVSGNTVTLRSTGLCTINAGQAGDSNYLAAAQVQQSFNVGVSDAPVAINVSVPQESNSEGGTLPGNLGVSSSGSATYSAPIQLPPGVNGMVPAFSLNYDSGNTSGSAGLGWSLSGFSSIDRCGKVYGTDQKTDGVRFTAADRLCLDGQRLVLVNGDASQDSSYWADGAQYRTEVESFVRVTALVVNAKRAFMVEGKGGRKSWYGETPDSYIEGVGRGDQLAHRWAINKAADASGNYITYTYTENATTGEVRPANVSWGGNSVRATPHFAKATFTFENRPDPRNKYVAGSRFDERLRLKKIETTVDQSDNSSGNWVAALTYTLNYTVSDSSGRSLLQTVVACDSQKCLPSTTFNWGARDPLATQGFVALGGVRTGPDLDKMAAETSHGQRETFIAADFNGDGRADIFERYRGSSNGTQHLYEMSADGLTWNVYTPFASSPEIRSLLDAADYDGDGKLDLLVADTSNKLRICPGRSRSGSSFSCALAVGIPSTIQAEVSNVSIHVTRDFNADGKDDLFLRTGIPGSPNYHSYQCLSSGAGFNCTEVTGTRDEVDMGSALYAEPPHVNAFADADGDGRVDTVVIPHCQFGLHDVETTRKWFCTSTGFGAGDEASGIISYNTPESGGPYFGGDIYQLPDLQTAIVPALRDATLLSDFNGDGYSDMVVGTKGLSNTDLSEGKGLLCLSRGDGYTDCQALPKSGFVNGVNRNHLALAIGDFDGDGVVDILRPMEDTWVSGATNVAQGYQLCRVGTDTTSSTDPLPLFQRCQAWNGPIFYTMGQHSIYDGADGGTLGRNSMFAGDFNGDGRQDIATYLGGNQWQFHTAAKQSKPGEALDKLISVTNGVGLFEQVQYGQASDSSIYSASANYPDGQEVAVGKLSYPTQQLVRSVSRGNGRGGVLTTNYNYYRQAQDAGGRGSLGFARIDSTDAQTAIVTSTWPWQAFPHIGATHYAQVKTASCILSDTTEARATAMLNMGSSVNTPYSYVSQSTVIRKDGNCADLGMTKVITGALDAFGNILTSTTTSTSNTNASGYMIVKGMKYDNVSFPARVGELRELTDTRTNNTGTLSRITAYTYDGNGLLKTETRQGDLTTQLLTTYNRDGFGNVTQTIVTWRDPVSNTDKNRTIADVTPTANGRFPYTVKNAIGQVETKTFDARSGAPKSVTTANALTMSWDSDGFGRKTRAVAIDGTETLTMLKNCQANCPAGATTVAIQETKRGTAHVAVPMLVFADSAGHALRSVTWGFDGTKIATDTIYDDRGRAADSYWPRFVNDSNWLADGLSVAAGAKISKHVEYDNLNRVTIVSTPDEQGVMHNSTTTYNGFTTTLVNPKLQSKSDTRDVWGKLESSLDANGKKTAYEHDAFGNLSKTTDPLNNVVVVKYDPWGRRTELNDPDMGKISYSVDPLGQVWRQVSAKQAAAGKATTTQYDDLGRMVSRVSQDATTSHSAVWNFDKKAGQVDCASFKSCGQLVESYTLLSDGVTKDNRRELSYDALGRPKTATYYRDVTYTSTTDYDAWGRPSKVAHQRGSGAAKVFGQFYNGFGQLARIERQGAVLWTADVKDANQQLKNATLGNGLKVTRDYYDYTGRLKAGQLLNAQSVGLLTEGYNYDVLGNVSLRTQSWQGQAFTELFDYDGLNRLKTSALGSDTQNFVYDDIGNILTKTNVGGNGAYAYNAPGPLGVGKRPHAVSSIPIVGSFSYDENGNMTSGAGRTMTWTAFDMPATITMGAESSTFVYGADYERTVQNKADGTRIYYAGAMEVETKGANTTVKTYWPLQLGVEIEKGGATNLSYTHADRLGSIVAITDASGNLVEKLAYDSWGKRRNLFDSGTSGAIDGVTDNKGYTGHEMLDQLDLVHMNGRVYDPLVARFLSADPFIQDPLHSQSYNRYSYVWNNPTNLTDPTGFVAANEETQGGNGQEAKLDNKKMEATYACLNGAGQQVNCQTGAVINGGLDGTNQCKGKDGTGGCSVVWRRASLANNNVWHEGGAADRFVEQHRKDMEAGNGAVYEPLQPYAVAGASAMLFIPGGAALATTATGRALLAAFGFASEVQNAADGLPPGGRAAGAAQQAAALEKGALINELGRNGVKFNAQNIVEIRKLADGRIVFLETGNTKAGLQHIMDAHGADFVRAGVPAGSVPTVVMDAVSHGKIVGYQGRDFGRPIYELPNGQRVAVTVGSNGFVVGANPAGR